MRGVAGQVLVPRVVIALPPVVTAGVEVLRGDRHDTTVETARTGTIRPRGKGGQVRAIPLPKTARGRGLLPVAQLSER
jgi:hypothetical protein